MVLLTVLVVSTVALAYALYVAMLVKEADFYSRAQKIAQCTLILALPVLGAALMHWLYLARRTRVVKPKQGKKEIPTIVGQ